MPYKIVYDKNGCIGAGECEAISKKLWKVKSDGKAELLGAKQNPATGKFEVVISDEEYLIQKKVVGSCPSGCMKLEKI